MKSTTARSTAGTATASAGKFTATIPINVGDTADPDKFANGANFIQVRDGANQTAASEQFTLNGTVTVTPTTLVKGTQKVPVKLEDSANETVTGITIGGVPVPFGTTDATGDLTTTGTADGTLTLAVANGTIELVINVPTGVATGSKELAINAGATKLGSTMVDITTLSLTLTPSTAVPGESVDLDGSGFGGGATVMSLKVGGQDAQGPPRNPATTNGRFFVTFTVPDVGDGTHTVTLTDSDGKIGEGTLIVPKPAITIDPASSRRGTPVRVTGTGFPATDSIAITYGGDDAGFARSDSAGNWDTVILVPTDAEIGKAADIVAERKEVSEVGQDDYKASRKSDAVEHMVPESELTLSADEAASGQMITITGTGFPPYSGVEVQFGNLPKSSAGVTTDGNGDFTARVQVPLLPPGSSHLLKVIVGGEEGKTITELFAIASADAMVSKAVEDVLADLIEGDNLQSAWVYNADTGGWDLAYSNNPLFAARVTVTELNSGDILWVSVSEDITFQGFDLKGGQGRPIFLR